MVNSTTAFGTLSGNMVLERVHRKEEWNWLRLASSEL